MQRQIPNGKQDHLKYCKLCKATRELESFLQNGRGKATIDDPEAKLSYHSCLVEIYNDEFDATEIEQFTDILKLFDGMMLVGDSNGNTSFSLLMEDVYKEEA
jgi:hypothetical protein